MHAETRCATEHATPRTPPRTSPHVLPHALLNHPFHRGSWKHL